MLNSAADKKTKHVANDKTTTVDTNEIESGLKCLKCFVVFVVFREEQNAEKDLFIIATLYEIHGN